VETFPKSAPLAVALNAAHYATRSANPACLVARDLWRNDLRTLAVLNGLTIAGSDYFSDDSFSTGPCLKFLLEVKVSERALYELARLRFQDVYPALMPPYYDFPGTQQ